MRFLRDDGSVTLDTFPYKTIEIAIARTTDNHA